MIIQIKFWRYFIFIDNKIFIDNIFIDNKNMYYLYMHLIVR